VPEARHGGRGRAAGSIVYTRDQLLNLRLCVGAGGRPDIPRELRRKYRGCRAGRRVLSPRVLKVCATQLCDVFRHIFNLSLSTTTVPVLWKTSCLVPVPKKRHASSHSDYRPVALTSHEVAGGSS